MINIEFKLSPINNIPEYISSDALDYWFTKNNFALLIKNLYKDRDFLVGDFFDFSETNTKFYNDSRGEYIFTRDISKDFENVLQIQRKTYSAICYKSGGQSPILTYELNFPNY